jgi:hypothetical protein
MTAGKAGRGVLTHPGVQSFCSRSKQGRGESEVKIKVEVQPKHVKKGVCSDPKKCAVAVALVDRGFKAVSVWGHTFDAYDVDETNLIIDNGSRFILPLPTKIRKFIDRFDEVKSWDKAGRRALAAKLRAKSLSFSVKLTPSQITKYLIPKAAKKLLKSKAA